MIRKVIALAGGVALVAGLGLAGTGAAIASPRANPAAVVGALGDTNGTAGWYTNEFAETATEVTATFTLPQTGIGDSGPGNELGDQGGLGDQLCDSNSGDVVQLGAVPTQAATTFSPELYSVGFGWGNLSTDATTNEDTCNGNGFFINGGAFTGLVTDVPAGDSVQVRAQVARQFGDHGPYGVWFYGEDTRGLVNFSQFEKFSSDSNFNVSGPFNEAAAGLSADQNSLAGPATTALSSFSNVTATLGGVTHGLAAFNAVSVSSSADGQVPWLITPTLISPSAFVRTFHPGHRQYFGPVGHRTGFKWIKGYFSSTGGGASSWVIDTATKVGE